MPRILIAEDDASMRNFLVLALRRAGHDADAAIDGKTAFDALQSGGPYDLLLTDIVMPGMDGIELSRRAARDYPAMKIMFITGFTAIALDRQGDIPDPAAKILAKPFHLKDLVDQVNAALAA